MKLQQGGAIIGGPPCSLQVWLCPGCSGSCVYSFPPLSSIYYFYPNQPVSGLVYFFWLPAKTHQPFRHLVSVAKTFFLSVFDMYVRGEIFFSQTPRQQTLIRSSSVHRRHDLGPLGDMSNRKVRLSNLIVQNTVTFLKLLKESGRLFWVVLEQPTSSWLFKMEWLLALGALLSCYKITTWFAFFQHDLLKPTHLWGNLPGLEGLSRTMTTAHREKFIARLDSCQIFPNPGFAVSICF